MSAQHGFSLKRVVETAATPQAVHMKLTLLTEHLLHLTAPCDGSGPVIQHMTMSAGVETAVARQ